MRQLIKLVWMISFVHYVSSNPDIINQQKSKFEKSKNIINYFPGKPKSRWESLNNAITFGSIFGQQNSSSLLAQSNKQDSQENAPSNIEAVMTSESEQQYKNCIMKCQALASVKNETIDEFSCGCDQILKPNKIAYKYRDEYITVKKNPFHAVKDTCQNCTKTDKQSKDNTYIKPTQNQDHLQPTPNQGIRIKNNGTIQEIKQKKVSKVIPQETPQETINSTTPKKQIKINKNPNLKVDKIKIKQIKDEINYPKIPLNKSKSKSQEKQIKNLSNNQVRIKNSNTKKQTVSPSKQEKITLKNNQTKEGIRIKQSGKQPTIKKEIKEEKQDLKIQSDQTPAKSTKKIFNIEEKKLDGQIRIKNNGSVSVPNIQNASAPAVKQISKKKQLKIINKTKKKGIPVKENVKYSYVNKTKPKKHSKKKLVKATKSPKKIFKSKQFKRKNETIPIKDNQKNKYERKLKKLNKKKQVKKQKKIPIKSKIVKKEPVVIKQTEPVEVDTRIRIKKEDVQQIIKPIKPYPLEQKQVDEEKQKEVKKPVEQKQIENEMKIKENKEEKQTDQQQVIKEEKQVFKKTEEKVIEKTQNQNTYEIRVKNSGFKNEAHPKQDKFKIDNISNSKKNVTIEFKDKSTEKEEVSIKKIDYQLKKQPEINQENVVPKVKKIESYSIRVKNNGSKLIIPKILKNKIKAVKKIESNEVSQETIQPVKVSKKEIQKQENTIEHKANLTINKVDINSTDHSIRIKNDGSKKIFKQKNHTKKNNHKKTKIRNAAKNKSLKKVKIITKPVEIEIKQKEIVNEDSQTLKNVSKQVNEYTYEQKIKKEQEKFQIRVKNNGKQQFKTLKKQSSKIEKSIEQNSSKVKIEKILPVQENKEQKDIKKPLNESKKIDLPKEDNSIRVKNNGSKKILKKYQKNKTKAIKKKKVQKQAGLQNISKSNKKTSSSISKDEVSPKIKSHTNKTVKIQHKKAKKQITNDSSPFKQEIRIKQNRSKDIASNQSIKKSKIIKKKPLVVKELEKNVSIKNKQTSINKTVDGPVVKKQIKIDKLDDSKIQDIKKDPVQKIDQSIRIKNNGSKQITQFKKKAKKNSQKSILKKIKKNISKAINKNNSKVHAPKPVVIIKKVEVIDQKKEIIENEKQEENKEEKRKELEIEKKYEEEVMKEQKKQQKVKEVKPDSQSIRVKNNGTITVNKIPKVKKIKKHYSIKNQTKKIIANDEPVPIIKDTKKYRNKINYTKPIEEYKKVLEKKQPIKKSVETVLKVNVTEESIRVKNSDLIPDVVVVPKISESKNITVPAKKHKTLKNKTKKSKALQKKTAKIHKPKSINQTKQQLKKNVTVVKKAKKIQKKELKKVAAKNISKAKKAVKKVTPPKITVKTYPVTNVPIHSRDVQKGASIPMKKRKSQKKKIVAKNITKPTKISAKKISNKTSKTKKHKKKLIPVMTKKQKVIDQPKVVKQMKKDESIQEKPMKSVVDEVISAPLKKPKKKSLLKNVSKSAKINKTKKAKNLNKQKVIASKNKSSVLIPKKKLIKKVNKAIKLNKTAVSKPKLQVKKVSVKNKTKPAKNIVIKKKVNNTKKAVKIISKHIVPLQRNNSIDTKPSKISKEKDELDDDLDEPIKEEKESKIDEDDDDKEKQCTQPKNKTTKEEIQREVRIKNSDTPQKSISKDNYKATVNYQTKNRTTTINFSDNDGSAVISITNVNGTQLLNVSGDKMACQSQFCKQFSSISQIFTNQRNMSMITPLYSDKGSLSQAQENQTLTKQEKDYQTQFINKKLNENFDYKEVLNNQQKLKHLSFRIQKLSLLGNLMKKFYNKNDYKKEWFQKPVIFHFLEFKFVRDKPKVSIIRSIRARNLQSAIKSFKITIKDKFLNSNNTHYGIVANSKLLFSTSAFKNYLDPKNSESLKKKIYTPTQNEFVNDNVSKIFIGYGFFKQIIKLPLNLRKQQATLLIVDKNSFAQEISQLSSFDENYNISSQQNKNKFVFDQKGNLVKSSETNFKAFITLVSSFQKKGLFKGAIFDQNQLGVKIRKGQPPKGLQRQFTYTFSPRTLRQVKQNKDLSKQSAILKENECQKYSQGSKRYQVCILNNQYQGPKQVVNLSRKYNFGAIVYDPERKKISKAADILSSSMRRGLKTIQWNLIQKYIKNRKEFQFMTFSENGPLICSKNRSDNLCKLMMGYSLTQGWWKNPKFIDSQKLDQFYVIVKNMKTNNIEFINTGCDQEYAISLMKKMTEQEKNSIGAVLNSDSQLVEMTLTDLKNEKDMKYEQIYEIIGEYLSNNLHLFDKNLRNEYEANIQ